MSDDKEPGLYRAGVTIGRDKHPVGLTGGSMTESEARERADKEEKAYKELGINAKGVIVPDAYPGRWPKNQNVGH